MHGLSIFLVVLLVSCSQPNNNDTKLGTGIQEELLENKIENLAENFFNTYMIREDWEEFLSYYADTLKFEDAVLQVSLDGLESFMEFYDWPNPDFQKHPDYPRIFELKDLVVDSNIAIGRGVFAPFYWKGILYEMEWDASFTMWLYYNEDGKIIRQIDWIEYSGDVLQSVGQRLLDGDY